MLLVWNSCPVQQVRGVQFLCTMAQNAQQRGLKDTQQVLEQILPKYDGMASSLLFWTEVNQCLDNLKLWSFSWDYPAQQDNLVQAGRTGKRVALEPNWNNIILLLGVREKGRDGQERRRGELTPHPPLCLFIALPGGWTLNFSAVNLSPAHTSPVRERNPLWHDISGEFGSLQARSKSWNATHKQQPWL